MWDWWPKRVKCPKLEGYTIFDRVVEGAGDFFYGMGVLSARGAKATWNGIKNAAEVTGEAIENATDAVVKGTKKAAKETAEATVVAVKVTAQETICALENTANGANTVVQTAQNDLNEIGNSTAGITQGSIMNRLSSAASALDKVSQLPAKVQAVPYMLLPFQNVTVTGEQNPASPGYLIGNALPPLERRLLIAANGINENLYSFNNLEVTASGFGCHNGPTFNYRTVDGSITMNIGKFEIGGMKKGNEFGPEIAGQLFDSNGLHFNGFVDYNLAKGPTQNTFDVRLRASIPAANLIPTASSNTTLFLETSFNDISVQDIGDIKLSPSIHAGVRKPLMEKH